MTDNPKNDTDVTFMRRAIELAKRGTGAVNPNPLVGAVIVKKGQILAEGWHERFGGLHAERNAIKHFLEKYSADELKGSTIYVTLEPCCHHGKTPPCTDAIIENGFARVVVGSNDPNPLVAGKGIKLLKAAGIEVVTEFLKEECDALNFIFFHYISTKEPYVTLKYAMTTDGKIATSTGKSKWITGEAARQRVHEDRNRYMAVMAGVGTVIADNPELTCRLSDGRTGRNPIRIICDTNLRTPLESRIAMTAKDIRTIIATSCADSEKQRLYIEKGIELTVLPQKDNHIDLAVLAQKLGEMGIDSVILEGGGTLSFSALKSGIVNRVQAYIAPKLFGGADAKTPVEGKGIDEVNECIRLTDTSVTKIGEDILLESEVAYGCLRG